MAINHNYWSCSYYSTYLRIEIRIKGDISSAFNRTWHILRSWQILAARPHLPWHEPVLSLPGWVLKRNVINMFRKPWNLYLKKTKCNCFPKTASTRPETLSHLLQRRVNIYHTLLRNDSHQLRVSSPRTCFKAFLKSCFLLTKFAIRWHLSQGPSAGRTAWPLKAGLFAEAVLLIWLIHGVLTQKMTRAYFNSV